MNLIMTQTELALGVGVLAADQWMEYHRPKRWHSADQSVYMQMCWPAKEQSNGVQRTKVLPCKRVGMLKNKVMACSGPKRCHANVLAFWRTKRWRAADQSVCEPKHWRDADLSLGMLGTKALACRRPKCARDWVFSWNCATYMYSTADTPWRIRKNLVWKWLLYAFQIMIHTKV